MSLAQAVSKSNHSNQETIHIGKLALECGAALNDVNIRYEFWGELNEQRDNAILITHSLTGTSHAAGNGYDGDSGWWDSLIGPGKPFDTGRYFVLCSNVLGGCSGSTGPASTNPFTAKPYGGAFPTITIRDMVHAQRCLLKQLDIQRLRTISGGSMGGMQALEWAALYPEMVDSIIPLAAPGRAYPQSIAYRKAQRRAIMMDPNWQQGHYYDSVAPKEGIEVARMMGFVTYRTEREFADRFGRRHYDEDPLTLTSRFEIEQYLEYHGKKLADWFDANTYLYLSKAMDLHDLGRGYDSYQAGIQRIKSAACLIGFDSDLLFPCYQQQEIAEILGETNPRACYREVATEFGHDGFLIEIEQLSDIINQFLSTLS